MQTGFEVCSPGEAEICNRAHIPAAQQVISGVYKTPSVMEKMIAQGNGPRLFTVESVRQFRLLSGLAEQYRKPINVLLRLTSGNQFGMEEQEIVQLVQEREEYPLVCIRGIQFFSGTQKTSLKRLRRELEAVDTFVCALQETCGFTVQELEFGPGFPVNYFQGQAFDEDAFLAGFSGLLAGLRCGARVTLELGRSIAASCGSYLTRVVDVKQNRGQNYAIVDGGMHQMVYYGQSMAMQHPQCRNLSAAERRCRKLEPVRLPVHGQRHPGQAAARCRAEVRRCIRLWQYGSVLHDRGHFAVPQPRAAAHCASPGGGSAPAGA